MAGRRGRDTLAKSGQVRIENGRLVSISQEKDVSNLSE